jgi:sulfur relay (sulfurtransferase) DsrC/TusE family protein
MLMRRLFKQSSQWNREICCRHCKEEGLAELTPAHWKVNEYFLQLIYKEKGALPTIRRI